MFDYKNDDIKIIEVGPRDGLQNEKEILSLKDKVEYIILLAKAGYETIEATSFVRADRIRQMSDAKDLYTKLINDSSLKGINFPCLVPNMKGYEIARSSKVKEIALFSATSDDFTQKNINCSVDESFVRMKEVAQEAKKDGVKIRGYISTAFGCPYVGKMSSDKLNKVAEKFLDLGVYEISVGDTIGVATPKQVDVYIKNLKQVTDKLAMHFHDTRGMALSNILVSLENDIRVFDTSSGGLGGCPYANGATGNVATEDVIYLLRSLGLKTRLNLDKVVEASRFILEKVNKQSPSKYFQTLK